MTKRKQKIAAIAYLRTSSAANVGADKDSHKRQAEAIQSYADQAGYDIVDTFYDAAVSGTDPIETREGFSQLLDRIEGNGVSVVIVEDASRLARDLMVLEVGIVMLVNRGVTVLTANGDDLTNEEDELKVALRRIVGAIVELEKTRLVKKLRSARARVRKEKGKCEGRKSFAELDPDMVAFVKRLRRRSPKTGKRRSLTDISQRLAAAGYFNERGRPFNHKSVRSMLMQ